MREKVPMQGVGAPADLLTILDHSIFRLLDSQGVHHF
jgi:hypothetical protein